MLSDLINKALTEYPHIRGSDFMRIKYMIQFRMLTPSKEEIQRAADSGSLFSQHRRKEYKHVTRRATKS